MIQSQPRLQPRLQLLQLLQRQPLLQQVQQQQQQQVSDFFSRMHLCKGFIILSAVTRNYIHSKL